MCELRMHKCFQWRTINGCDGKPIYPGSEWVQSYPLRKKSSAVYVTLLKCVIITSLHYSISNKMMVCVAVVKPSLWMCICPAVKGYLCHTRVNHWQPSLMCARVWMQRPWITWHINRPVGRDFLCISKYNPGTDNVWERWINHQWLRIISVAVQG